MDQLDNIYTSSKYLLPWSVFLIAFLGSLHCVGMCGGLVLSCAPKLKNNILYQLGRLISYSILAVLAGSLGNYFSFSQTNPWASIIPSVFIGFFLVYTGVKLILKKKGMSFNISFLSRLRNRAWAKILPKVHSEVSYISSFLVGLFSILLPCGFLYGVILALATFNSPLLSLISIFCFWLGTLPAMSIAPGLIKSFLRPLYMRMPLITSSFLIIIGFLTIANRVALAYKEVNSCH